MGQYGKRLDVLARFLPFRSRVLCFDDPVPRLYPVGRTVLAGL